MYIYHGYCLTEGLLDNGKPWYGVAIFVHEGGASGLEIPRAGIIAKGKRVNALDKRLELALQDCTPGLPVHMDFDIHGKCLGIRDYTDDELKAIGFIASSPSPTPLYADKSKKV